MPAPERQRVELIFGEGLDRETGVYATREYSMEDQQNVILYEGKAQVRRGHLERSTLVLPSTVPCTHTLAIQSLRTQRLGVAVGYESVSREVHVFTTSSAGTNPQHVGLWFTLDQAAVYDPPIIVTTETRGRVYLAHAEPNVTNNALRAETFVFDPQAAVRLSPLEIDLRGTGYSTVRFRGVQRWRNYLLGWGYGTDLEPHRPELVRISLAGLSDDSAVPFDPKRVFDKNHYFLPGQRNEPVLGVAVAGLPGRALMFKETEFHTITGSGWHDFDWETIDDQYGLAAPRLIAQTEDGQVFFWSIHGPRFTQGGPSQDLVIPLDLRGPPPAQLVAEGALDFGFAIWNPFDQTVEFYFGRRCYMLSLRSQPWKWSYKPIGFEPFCAGQLFTTATLAGAPGSAAPTGHPALDQPLTFGGVQQLQVAWDNVGAVGDEIVEVWIKAASASAYTLAHSVLTTAGPDQIVILTGPATWMVLDELHSIALRYRRGTAYGVGYTDPDPANWPGVSQGTATPTSAGVPLAPTLSSVVWFRTSSTAELLRVTWVVADPSADTEVHRNTILVQTQPPTVSSWDNASVTGETLYAYKVRHELAGQFSPFSAEISRWVGPEAPSDAGVPGDPSWWRTSAPNGPGGPYDLSVVGVVEYPAWTYLNPQQQPVKPTLSVEVWVRQGAAAFALQGTVPVDAVGNFSFLDTLSASGDWDVRLRVRALSYTNVVDLSQFTQTRTETIPA